MRADLSLCLVTDAAASAKAGRTVVETVRRAVDGGVTAVQVRDKNSDTRALLELVREVARAVPRDVAVLVNDRVDVFLAARRDLPGLAGVHVGQSDLPVEHVRALVGDEAIVGLSASTLPQLREAAASSAAIDYVGIGAVHPTATKADAPPALGIDGVAQRAAAIPLPAVAIGGIVPGDAAALRAVGLAGIAVASAIGGAEDPAEAARLFSAAWSRS